MTTNYKVLGQINPAANAPTVLYTVPAAVSSVVSSIVVCNQAATPALFTLSVQPGGGAIVANSYLNYNTTINANDTISLVLGLTMATTDVLSARASTGNVSFNAFGAETTVASTTYGPIITGFAITNSSYTALSATTMSTLGGFIQLNGSGFTANCTVYVNSVPAITTNCVNGTTIYAQLPAASAGTQALSVFNGSGAGYLFLGGLTYSAAPVWTTGTYLSTGAFGSNVSVQLSATTAGGTGPVTYSLASGSTLPAGVALSSTGLLSGTRTAGVYTFTVTATNALSQITNQAITLTVTSAPSNVNLLIVAGGGGGGYAVTNSGGGGGGAGGYRSLSGIGVVTGSTYVINVGAGGSGGYSANVTAATNGTDSSAWNEIATGGGHGGDTAADAAAGGSGGGANGAGGSAAGSGNNPAKTPAQGFSGGSGGSGLANQQSAGGGGGAATVGISATDNTSGAGGAGVTWVNGVTYAGGGGGGASILGRSGAGGIGGGGAGANTNSAASAVSGTANTGGGGGGAGYTLGANGVGGSGGSGLVAISYSDSYSPPSSITGNPIVTDFAGVRTYVFTSSGTITF